MMDLIIKRIDRDMIRIESGSDSGRLFIAQNWGVGGPDWTCNMRGAAAWVRIAEAQGIASAVMF